MPGTSAFFKLFPPPRFLTMPHAGLDVSDDGIRAVRYSGMRRFRKVELCAKADFPQGLVDGGDIKDDKEFAARLAEFAKLHKISRVKVSIPEEKAYLFQTDMIGADPRSVAQNIEFKLEENVPLSASDALFFYEPLPSGGTPRASVSVVPRSYIERYTSILIGAGMYPTSFEIGPKAVARAAVAPASADAKIIVNVGCRTTGIYVVSGGVLCFTSTVAGGAAATDTPTPDSERSLAREITRVYSYWQTRDSGRPVDEIILVGHSAASFEDAFRKLGGEIPLPVKLGNVWQNAFSLERYIPPVSREDSLEYAAAIGLAFDSVVDP